MSRASLDLDDPQQPYRQVAARLRAAIGSGELAVGERMKSVRELAREYGVASGTVQQALRILRDEGLITTWQGRGTFVRRTPTTHPIDDASAAVIMQRLDEVLDRVERLEDQVSELRSPHDGD